MIFFFKDIMKIKIFYMKGVMQKSTYKNIVKNKILIVGKIILD